MRCKCGFENGDTALYCGQCGSPLKKKGGPEGKKKKGIARWWWVIVVVVAVIAIGVVLTIVLTRDKGAIKDSIGTQQTEPVQEDGIGEEEEQLPPAEPEASDSEKGVWQLNEDGSYSYLVDDEPLTQLQELAAGEIADGSRSFAAGWYLFDESGKMLTGWQKVEEAYHYFTPEGAAAASGWYSDSKGWYCLAEKGRLLQDEEIAQGQITYFLNDSGYLSQIQVAELSCVQKTATIAGKEVNYLELEESLENCKELSFRISLNGSEDDSAAKDVKIWLRVNGAWKDFSNAGSVNARTDGSYRLELQEEVSFDGLYVQVKPQEHGLQETLYEVLIGC